MEGAQCQAALEMLQGFPAPTLQQQQQPPDVEVVLPAVRTQRPGVQVFQQSVAHGALALFVPHGRTAFLRAEREFTSTCRDCLEGLFHCCCAFGSAARQTWQTRRTKSYLAGLLGEPDVERLEVVGLARLALLFELLVLSVQGLEPPLRRGRAEETVEFTHGEDFVVARGGFGVAQLVSVPVRLQTRERKKGQRSGFLSAAQLTLLRRFSKFKFHLIYVFMAFLVK